MRHRESSGCVWRSDAILVPSICNLPLTRPSTHHAFTIYNTYNMIQPRLTSLHTAKLRPYDVCVCVCMSVVFVRRRVKEVHWEIEAIQKHYKHIMSGYSIAVTFLWLLLDLRSKPQKWWPSVASCTSTATSVCMHVYEMQRCQNFISNVIHLIHIVIYPNSYSFCIIF